MNKVFFIRYISIIHQWIQQMSKLTNTPKCNINVLSEKIISFFYHTSEYFFYEKSHFMVILVYFRRFLNAGDIHTDPYVVFVVSAIYCTKFCEDLHYRNSVIAKSASLSTKCLFAAELRVLQHKRLNVWISPGTLRSYEDLVGIALLLDTFPKERDAELVA